MPLPSHRLDLWFVCERAPSLQAESLLPEILGSRAEPLVEGGARAWSFERFGQPRFVANQQGGFRVRCPVCAGNLVPSFSAALAAWKRGAAAEHLCPHCGDRRALSELSFAPAAAFGEAGLHLVDVASSEPDPEVRAQVEAHIGPSVLVARRVG